MFLEPGAYPAPGTWQSSISDKRRHHNIELRQKDAWQYSCDSRTPDYVPQGAPLVTEDRELLITAIARHQAHHHHCSLHTATCQIRNLVAKARAEHHCAGSPTATTIAASVVGCSRARA
jgi:hypothetical protein